MLSLKQGYRRYTGPFIKSLQGSNLLANINMTGIFSYPSNEFFKVVYFLLIIKVIRSPKENIEKIIKEKIAPNSTTINILLYFLSFLIFIT